ncbi:hypothetical protein AVS7_03810, partial [Acidovorax sp. MR-S7]
MVDATLIAAPSSTKNTSGERDPQMKQSKKGNTRNGKSKKTLKGDFGELPIEVPR